MKGLPGSGANESSEEVRGCDFRKYLVVCLSRVHTAPPPLPLRYEGCAFLTIPHFTFPTPFTYMEALLFHFFPFPTQRRV